MGNAASLKPLGNKEINNLSKKYSITPAGISFYHEHYCSLLNGLRQENLNEEEKAKLWFLEKTFTSIFEQQSPTSPVTFVDYLDTLMKWKSQSPEERIELYFDMLDFNKDGTLTPSDLSIFVQQSQGYQCKVGDTVRIRNDPREGTLAYIGATGFADGVWAGINLKEPLGKNNGTVDGKKYFEAKDKHGVFVDFAVVELDQHWKTGKNIIELFGGGKENSLNKEAFVSKCAGDKWLMSRILIDPIPQTYKIE